MRIGRASFLICTCVVKTNVCTLYCSFSQVSNCPLDFISAEHRQTTSPFPWKWARVVHGRLRSTHGKPATTSRENERSVESPPGRAVTLGCGTSLTTCAMHTAYSCNSCPLSRAAVVQRVSPHT